MGKGGGGGGAQTVNTQVEPPEYAKPFLEFGLAEAKDQYMSDLPGGYPGSSVVGFSPESEMALTGVRDRALDPNSLTAQTQGVVQQNLMAQTRCNGCLGRWWTQSRASLPRQAVTDLAQTNRRWHLLAPAALQAQQAAIRQAPTVQNLDMQQLARLAPPANSKVRLSWKMRSIASTLSKHRRSKAEQLHGAGRWWHHWQSDQPAGVS